MRSPRLLHSDFCRTQIDVDVMVVTLALRDRWDTVTDRMSAETNRRAQREVGGVLGAFHAHVGTAFGVDVVRTPAQSSDTWAGAFDMLLDGQLAKARARGVKVAERAIRAAALAEHSSLATVVTLRLLPGDCGRVTSSSSAPRER
jgi:hypothetical protein